MPAVRSTSRPRRAPHSSDDTIDEHEIDTLNKEIDELAKTIDDPETGLKKQTKDTEESLEATSRIWRPQTHGETTRVKAARVVMPSRCWNLFLRRP